MMCRCVQVHDIWEDEIWFVILKLDIDGKENAAAFNV